MLVEVQGLRILVDPGSLTEGKQPTTDIDVVLITHEHFDHLHVPSVKAVLADSPNAKIYTIPSAGELLAKDGVAFALLGDGQSVREGGVLIEAVGEKHAQMHPDVPQSSNTGFFIAERFFFPGDAFTLPSRRPEILALPCAGPWMKIGEAVDYARAVKPDVCFPVHDGILTETVREMLTTMLPRRLLEPLGIRVLAPKNGETMEFVPDPRV